MNAVLLTGASGFVGQALIPKLLAKGHKVYGLSRHPPEARENLIPLVGDITEPNLGLGDVPGDIHCVHHLAGIHRLGEDRDGSIWQTNVEGTRNVIDFCERYEIPCLYFTSTAYTQGRNTYEQSKAFCESMVGESRIPRVTIFKPSIIMGTPQHFYPGHFSQFITLVVKVHQRAEVVRRRIEGSLRLPIIEPVFQIRANPGGKLNLISIDDVADAMARIDKPGTYWLTHPNPPTLAQLIEWVGEFIMVRMVIKDDFHPTPIEAGFQKMTSAFTPYMWGDEFPSDLKRCLPISKEFIHDTIREAFHQALT